MRTFLSKTFFTLLLFGLGVIAFFFIVHIVVKYRSDFRVSNAGKYMVFGHSHPECAFNDDLIGNFTNISESGESYFYTYQKVKKVLSNNNVNVVFIEYTNNLIDKKMDEWIWGYDMMNAYFPLYSPFMDQNDILFLYKNNPKDFPSVVSSSTRLNFTRILSFDFEMGNRYGGYKKLEKNNIAELLERKRNIANDTVNSGEISYSNLDYLEKIIKYCNSKKVKVVFVRSPQHRLYPRNNEEALLKLKEEKFKDIEFLDFDNFPLKDADYFDFEHLNVNGAAVFSSWFNDLLEKGLMSKQNKMDFITNEMEALRDYSQKELALKFYNSTN